MMSDIKFEVFANHVIIPSATPQPCNNSSSLGGMKRVIPLDFRKTKRAKIELRVVVWSQRTAEELVTVWIRKQIPRLLNILEK